ncbi:MAG: 2-oxoacid:acceptor oxidoreductase family protein [Desulfobacteraceae bacterium]
MIELRFHGRGGQGTVVASKILGDAVFLDGGYPQSFPAFGVERRGAPVTAFLRVSGRPILVRTEIYEPDHLVVLDPLLMDQIHVAKGLKKGGWIIVNSGRDPGEFASRLPGYFLATVPAGRIALSRGLGTRQAPIANTAILGAVNAVLMLVSQVSLMRAISENVSVLGEENARAAEEAAASVSLLGKPHGRPEEGS